MDCRWQWYCRWMQYHCWNLDSFLRDSFLALGPLSQSLGSACTVSSDPMVPQERKGAGGLSVNLKHQ